MGFKILKKIKTTFSYFCVILKFFLKQQFLKMNSKSTHCLETLGIIKWIKNYNCKPIMLIWKLLEYIFFSSAFEEFRRVHKFESMLTFWGRSNKLSECFARSVRFKTYL